MTDLHRRLRRRPMLDGPIRFTQPDPGAGYPQLLRERGPAGPYRVARPLVGAVLGLALFLTLAPLVTEAVTGLGWLAAGQPGRYADYTAAASRFAHPVGMLAANLGIAAVLLPLSAALLLGWHRRPPGWLASVDGHVRWRWLAVCVGIAVPVYGALLALGAADLAAGTVAQSALAGFLVVVVLTAPLQAAAEEVFFRGYLTQALGSLTAGSWLGIGAPALVFALLHGTQNLPLFTNRLAFGVLAGLLVWATGGLEAAIAAHVVNNVLAYGAAALTGTVTDLRGADALTWPAALTGIAGYAAFAAVAVGLARHRRIHRVVTAARSCPPVTSAAPSYPARKVR